MQVYTVIINFKGCNHIDVGNIPCLKVLEYLILVVAKVFAIIHLAKVLPHNRLIGAFVIDYEIGAALFAIYIEIRFI